MEMKTKLEKALKDAMRAGNDIEKRTIRMALSNIKLEEVSKGSQLDDTAVMNILQKEIRIRREAIADAEKAGRSDLIKQNEDDIYVLESLLPKQLSEEELRTIASEAIREVGATGPTDMGRVMKVVLPKVQGQAPNDQVSKIVRQLLTS